ncbi:hypothetical protein GQ42DRAFT_163538 [Ramicandelaber brevisporus]|nr:hypothetical protein GQ42DRAFT_163538 [Ramicandelaber brevisporus]
MNLSFLFALLYAATMVMAIGVSDNVQWGINRHNRYMKYLNSLPKNDDWKGRVATQMLGMIPFGGVFGRAASTAGRAISTAVKAGKAAKKVVDAKNAAKKVVQNKAGNKGNQPKPSPTVNRRNTRPIGARRMIA